MNTRPTPETNELIKTQLARVGMTPSVLVTKLTVKCESLERERDEYRAALEQIRANPGWQDPEVGFMAGHIAAGALNLFRENTLL
jgi:hypothetical protein